MAFGGGCPGEYRPKGLATSLASDATRYGGGCGPATRRRKDAAGHHVIWADG